MQPILTRHNDTPTDLPHDVQMVLEHVAESPHDRLEILHHLLGEAACRQLGILARLLRLGSRSTFGGRNLVGRRSFFRSRRPSAAGHSSLWQRCLESRGEPLAQSSDGLDTGIAIACDVERVKSGCGADPG